MKLGQWLSVNAEFNNVGRTSRELASCHPSSENNIDHRFVISSVVAFFSSAACYKGTSTCNEWRVEGRVSAGSIDNTSVYRPDMYNYSYMLCDFENVALGHKNYCILKAHKNKLDCARLLEHNHSSSLT